MQINGRGVFDDYKMGYEDTRKKKLRWSGDGHFRRRVGLLAARSARAKSRATLARLVHHAGGQVKRAWRAVKVKVIERIDG